MTAVMTRRRALVAAGLALAASVGTLAPSTAAWAQASGGVAGTVPSAAPSARVIVHWREGASALALGAAAERLQRLQSRAGVGAGVTLRQGRQITPRSEVVMAEGLSAEQLMARLARDPQVQAVEIDHRLKRVQAVPNDPRFDRVGLAQGGPVSGQWYLKAPAGEVRSSINAVGAWSLSTGSTNVVVAVLDTGVRFDHPDLLRTVQGGPLLDGRDFIAPDNAGRFTDGSVNGGTVFATAADGDGRDADAADPGDYLTQQDIAGNSVFASCDVEPTSSWHGTQVAGIIAAATNNGVGVASVARNVRVLPVRVLGKCGGYTSDIAAAMRWAAGLSVPGEPINPTPARVLNLSLGGGTGTCDGSPTLFNAVRDVSAAGAVIVVAAGNSAGQAVSRPANCPGAIAVAGLRHVGTKVGFSDLGPEVAISAPGGNCVNVDDQGPCLYPIVSTTNSGLREPAVGGTAYTDGIDASVGTSFSAPMVSGVVALMVSLRPDLTPSQVRAALASSARAFPASTDPTVSTCRAPSSAEQLECTCTTSTCGAGMLDAEGAVRAAAGLPPGTYTPPVIPTEPPVAGGGGGGGGGGALGGLWLLALGLAAVALQLSRQSSWRRR
jgi:serine protease